MRNGSSQSFQMVPVHVPWSASKDFQTMQHYSSSRQCYLEYWIACYRSVCSTEYLNMHQVRIRLFVWTGFLSNECFSEVPPSLLEGRQAVTTVPCNFIATHGRHDWDYALCFVGV